MGRGNSPRNGRHLGKVPNHRTRWCDPATEPPLRGGSSGWRARSPPRSPSRSGEDGPPGTCETEPQVPKPGPKPDELPHPGPRQSAGGLPHDHSGYSKHSSQRHGPRSNRPALQPWRPKVTKKNPRRVQAVCGQTWFKSWFCSLRGV